MSVFTRSWSIVVVAFCVAVPLGHGQAASAAPPPGPIQTKPATEGQVREYFELTQAIETAHRLMRQMVDGMQTTSAPYLPKAFWDDFRSTFDSIDLSAALIPAYQKYFSQTDMQQVLLFYKSTAGQHLLSAQPSIQLSAGEVLRRQGAELGRQVAERHQDEIEAAKKKYDDDLLRKQNAPK